MHRGVKGDKFPMGVRTLTRECLHQFSDVERNDAETLIDKGVFRKRLLFAKGSSNIPPHTCAL
jgi:hypothetical protein